MSVKNPERNIWNASHIMVDIETLGGSPTKSLMASIAAMRFDPLGYEVNPPVIPDSDYDKMSIVDIDGGIFYKVLNIKDQLAVGREFDVDTLRWWTEKPEKAAILNQMLTVQPNLNRSFADQLLQFSDWVKQLKLSRYVYMWAYGNSFDVSFLEAFYKQYAYPFPFHYQGLMDARTLLQMYELVSHANFPHREDSRSHHALADVCKQIEYVQRAVAFLKH